MSLPLDEEVHRVSRHRQQQDQRHGLQARANVADLERCCGVNKLGQHILRPCILVAG
jgi:hypothetical protein